MIPTLVGLVVLLVSVVLLVTARIEAMMAMAMICSLMGGSAALIVTALGSSSIPPISVVMGFLLVRVIVSGHRTAGDLTSAVRVNALYLLYAGWAVITAMVMPRIFARRIDVVPLRPVGLRNLFDTFPLVFSNQNITSSVYIVGSCLLALSVFVAVRQRRGAVFFAKTAAVVTMIHALLGLAGLVLPASIWGVVSAIFKNGSYAQLDQTIGGFERVTGILPEASAYAAYGFCWLVLVAELWLRDVLPRRTGLAAVMVGAMLIISTSSTAYVSLAAYALLLLGRFAVFTVPQRVEKLTWMIAGALLLVTFGCSLVVLLPAFSDALLAVFRHLTVDKLDSSSGLQRGFWAKQGLSAFKVSHGLGIGAGSFRSSNIFTAILGSMGVIGVSAWLAYVCQVLRPLHRTTYLNGNDKVDAVGIAASWAAICVIIPGMLAAPSPDLGTNFSIFAAAALGLRRRPQASSQGVPVAGVGPERRLPAPSPVWPHGRVMPETAAQQAPGTVRRWRLVEPSHEVDG